jgi:DNA-binding CsgD family transcriptional regulator
MPIEQQSARTLLGRSTEMRTLSALVTGARNGIGSAAVIRGEPGIGKTALLNALTNDLPDVRLVRADGYEAESSIPYAALQRVGLGFADVATALAPRYRQALGVACGAEEGPVPDRFQVGLAMLALFAQASVARPVVCVIDDAQWLDSDSLGVLTFVARRLRAESAVLLFASRDESDTDVQFAGIGPLPLTGLDEASAIQLLRWSVPQLVDPFTAARIASATGGHPLALIDLAHDLNTRQAGDLSLSLEPIPIGRRLEAHYLRQVRDTSDEVQQWTLLAAAEASGHVQLIETAAKDSGLSSDCGAEAQRAGLVNIGGTIVFRHPLVRSAVYGAAPGQERRRAHAALARAAEQLGLVELEARNAAEATPDLDPQVAERLEAAAVRAAKRGALISQARLLSRAADLSVDGPIRNARLLAAAEAAVDAGGAHLARDLLDRMDPEELDPVQEGALISARRAIGLFLADPKVVVRAAAEMVHAADRFHGHDNEREQKALLSAYEQILGSESLTVGTTITALGHRLERGARAHEGVYAVVLEALAALILRPYADAAPAMREALNALEGLDDAEILVFNYIGFIFSTALFDAAASESYLDRVARVARDTGALRSLDMLLWIRSLFECDRGNPAAAVRYIEEVRELRRAIGYDAENVVNVSCLVWAGMPRDDVDAIIEITRQLGFGGVCTSANVALGIREIAEGRYEDAYRRIGPMVAQRFGQVTDHQLADYVEAAVRSGHAAEAGPTVDLLDEMARASATPWLAGLAARSRALLYNDASAEPYYLRAIEQLRAANTPNDLGRAHQLYGEWLRRLKRRREAGEQLSVAVDIFDRIASPAFAKRARSELAATGAAVTARTEVSGVTLSSQEAAVARLAAAGNTNAEIAATMFLSTNTVDYHLRKVFAKFGISSRRQLSERFVTSD